LHSAYTDEAEVWYLKVLSVSKII